jgi:pimeloyl-ACP methyl ester carboxylesterase
LEKVLEEEKAKRMNMKKVLSKDGTPIAYDQVGNGPAVILVAGALGVRSHPIVGELARLLAPHFTVIDYDRRGRGDSGDTLPYAVEREVEDIEALIDEAGGSVSLYGISSGAVLALDAASRLPTKVKKLVMYEPPFIIDDSRPPIPEDYVRQLNDAIAAGRPGDAVEIFMTRAVGIPAEFVAQMRNAPVSEVFDSEMKPPEWAEMEKVAHTLAYDGAIMGETMSGKPLPAGKWASATAPTLVMTGGNSETFFERGARSLVNLLPNAQYRTLEGQDHAVSPQALAPVLVEFFSG